MNQKQTSMMERDIGKQERLLTVEPSLPDYLHGDFVETGVVLHGEGVICDLHTEYSPSVDALFSSMASLVASLSIG